VAKFTCKLASVSSEWIAALLTTWSTATNHSIKYLGQHYNKEAVLSNFVAFQSGVILENFPLVYEQLVVGGVDALSLSHLDDPLHPSNLHKQSRAVSRLLQDFRDELKQHKSSAGACWINRPTQETAPHYNLYCTITQTTHTPRRRTPTYTANPKLHPMRNQRSKSS